MNKKLKQEISNLNEKVDKLLDGSIINKANKCDFYEKNIKNIKLKVSKIKPVLVDGTVGLTIEYQIKPVTIFLNGEEVYPNEIFKSINLLDLISFEDMQKIQSKIEDIVQLQKNNTK